VTDGVAAMVVVVETEVVVAVVRVIRVVGEGEGVCSAGVDGSALGLRPDMCSKLVIVDMVIAIAQVRLGFEEVGTFGKHRRDL